jgi:hypothetical protein
MNKGFLAVILAICLQAVVFAQNTSGRIVGTVSAPDGVVPGATIVIRDNQTGREQTVTASNEGVFTFPQVEFGTYTVTITATGYKTFIASEVKIDAGREYPLNALLEVGQISEEVTIVAGAEQINSTNAELSTTISTQDVRELPLNGRNPLSLVNLQAGSNPNNNNVNGTRTASTTVTRDGVNIQDNYIRTGRAVPDAPSVDDVSEITVVTQNAGVETGGGSSVIQLVTPRGGNEFHGNLFAFNRNSAFSANTRTNKLAGIDEPPFLNRNQYGGSISGPVPIFNFGEGGPMFLKNKAFFFFNYEAFRLASQVSATSRTLLPQSRNGDFTYVGTDNVTRTVNVLTGQGFNLAPAANQTMFNQAGGALVVDPIIQSRILSQLPNAGNSTTFGINYLQDINFLRGNKDTRNSYTGRFDLDINSRNSANAVYKYTNGVSDAGGHGFSTEQSITSVNPTHFFSSAWRTSIGNNFSNELRFGLQKAAPYFVGEGVPTDFIIVPTITITSPENDFLDQGRTTDFYTLQNNAVYAWGNHSLRFGGQFDSYQVIRDTRFGIVPSYTISSTANTATPGFTGTGANALIPFADATTLSRVNTLRYFLGGIIGSGSLSNYLISPDEGYGPVPNIDTFQYKTYAAYISDQWRVRPNFTLNLGLRYEYFTPLYTPVPRMLEAVITDPNDFESSLLGPGAYLDYVGTNVGKIGQFFGPDRNNFAPSVSFAYSPQFESGLFSKLLGGDLVIRGGFRITNVNDEYVRAPIVIGTNAGAGRVNVSAVRGNGSALLRSSLSGANAGFEALPGFSVPAFTPPPRLISTNNAALNFSSITYGVRPDFEVPQMYEWNVGIQRNIGWGFVGEVRYVGNKSNNLARTIDINQIDIAGSGLLADFQRAQNNCRLQATAPVNVGGAGINPANVFDPIFSCTDPRYNPAIPGSQQLTILQGQVANNGAFLTAAANLQNIQRGEIGSLAQRIVTQRLFGTAQLQSSYEGLVMEVLSNEGRLSYNALQAEVRRRFSNGFSFQANYTFAKTLGDILSDTNADQSRAGVRLVDNNAPNLNYGRPDFDRTHVFNSNFVYELPFGRGKSFFNQGGWLNHVVGGWQISGIATYASGAPMTIVDPRSTLGITSNAGRVPARTTLTREELRAVTGIFVTPNGTFFFDPKILYAEATGTNLPTLKGIDLNQPLPAGYTVTTVRAANPIDQAPFPGQVFFYNNAGEAGNIGINNINGLPYYNVDMGISKNFRFGERMRLQLRAEAFNLFNWTVQSYSADTDISSTNFGRITASYPKRIIQFGARFDF